MKRKIKFKIISLLLVFSMLVSYVPIMATELNENEKSNEDAISDISDSSSNIYSEFNFSDMLPGELSLNELENAVLSIDDIPEIISSDMILNKGHVNRLKVKKMICIQLYFKIAMVVKQHIILKIL